MLSTDTIGIIRTCAFGASGLACALYAALTLWMPQMVPSWVPLAASGVLAITIFAAFSAAGPRNAQAAQDESYRADNARAAALGFWGALIMGLSLWITGAGGAMQLAVTLTGASAIYMLAHVIFDARGRGWL